MKKSVLLIASLTCMLFFLIVSVNGQPWTPVGIHTVNPNNALNGFVGIGTNAAPLTLLDVSRNMIEPTIRIRNLGGPGGATFQMTDVATNGDWKFKVVNGGHFKIRDQVSALDVVFISKNAATNSIYIAQGGNVGIGHNNPMELLDVNGAVRIGNTLNSNPGTIRWDGVNFLGFNGVSWLPLDFQYNDPWLLLPNIPNGTPEFASGPQPMSLSFAFPGVPNSLARLYVTDMSAPPLFPHQIAIETMTGGPTALNASQLFRISVGLNPPFIDYSMGIFGGDGTFKLCFSPALTPSAQSDVTTMFRVHPMGIIDLPNQSRVRAFQVNPAGSPLGQLIMPNIWTPVNFNFDAPMPIGFDEQNEFTVAGAFNLPAPPENAWFTAAMEGYYQVNARCEFNIDYFDNGTVMVNTNSYVSIAIWTGPAPGATASYAIGNNLQIGYQSPTGIGKLFFNNAPNVSDVVYLMAGQIISIRVFHTANSPMNLNQGSDKVYLTIHKVS